MHPKLQDFLRYCENKDSIVLFFKLAGELLEHLQLPDDSEKVVLNVTKGTDRRMSFDLNSRLVLTLYHNEKLGFMLGREFIDLHRTELEIDYEAEFTNKEPIASFVSFPYDFVSDRLDLFKNEWLKCCKEYSLRNERSPYLKNHMPELLKYVRDPELILSEKSAGDSMRTVAKSTKENQSKITIVESPPLNLILYGPPGTGKTYNSINKALSIIDPVFDLNQERKMVKAEFDKYVAEGRIAFTTFHQSMSYEDFVEGLKPVEPDKQGDPVIYNIQPGIFKMICQSALTPNQAGFDKAYEELKNRLLQQETIELETPDRGAKFSISLNSKDNLTLLTGKEKNDQGTLTKENIQKHLDQGQDRPSYHSGYFKAVINYLKSEFKYSDVPDALQTRNYALIIDEINRGNIAQIFGELITLIEEDKRLGREESLEAILPYSKEKFGVPPNLYIIGTMNTADRSVEALDTALRRRFSFEEISPNPGLLTNTVEGVVLRDLLVLINKRIEKLLDKDHQIGHSYFMKVSTLNDLRIVFSRNIIPLLQEYFFGDFGKMGLVLGTGFFEVYESGDTFAEFFEYEKGELEERPVYRIKRVIEMSNEEFKSALETLINNA